MAAHQLEPTQTLDRAVRTTAGLEAIRVNPHPNGHQVLHRRNRKVVRLFHCRQRPRFAVSGSYTRPTARPPASLGKIANSSMILPLRRTSAGANNGKNPQRGDLLLPPARSNRSGKAKRAEAEAVALPPHNEPLRLPLTRARRATERRELRCLDRTSLQRQCRCR